MKITVTSTYITIGNTTYPLNSLFFKSDGTVISVYQIGVQSAIITAPYDQFKNSSNVTYSTADAVMTDLKTSLVAP